MQTVIRRRSAAWPTLVGIQGIVLLALGVTLWGVTRTDEVEHPPIENRLRNLDIPSATAAMDHAIDAAENQTALTESDVLRVTSFLALAGQGAGLDVEDIRIETVAAHRALPGVQPMEAVIDLAGDIYDLPIFLDGAHRQRVQGTLQSLAFDVKPGGTMRGQVRIRYLRPITPDIDWIESRLAVAAPGAAAATPVLERAAVLTSWRVFNDGDAERSAQASDVRERAARELPPNLVTLRQAGGRFVWDADAGIAIR